MSDFTINLDNADAGNADPTNAEEPTAPGVNIHPVDEGGDTEGLGSIRGPSDPTVAQGGVAGPTAAANDAAADVQPERNEPKPHPCAGRGVDERGVATGDGGREERHEDHTYAAETPVYVDDVVLGPCDELGDELPALLPDSDTDDEEEDLKRLQELRGTGKTIGDLCLMVDFSLELVVKLSKRIAIADQRAESLNQRLRWIKREHNTFRTLAERLNREYENANAGVLYLRQETQMCLRHDDEHRRRFKGCDDNFKRMGDRIRTVNGEIKTLRDGVHTLIDDIGATKHRVEELEERPDNEVRVKLVVPDEPQGNYQGRRRRRHRGAREEGQGEQASNF